MRKDLMERKEEILKWISDGWSFSKMYRELKCSRDTLYSFLKKNNIEYHGNQGSKGVEFFNRRKTYSDMIDSIENGCFITNSRLRDRIIQDGAKNRRCELCGLEEWNKKPIVLELHHKDFNHHNSKFENLMLLCSNCHSYIHHYKIIL